MADFSSSTEEIYSYAKELRSIAMDMEETLSSIQTIIDNTSSGWKGGNAEVYVEKMEGFKTNVLKPQINNIYKISNTLMKTGSKVEETQSDIKQKIANLGMIATSASGALGGNYVSESSLTKDVWNDSDNLSYKDHGDGTYQIMRDGAVIGYTTEDNIVKTEKVSMQAKEFYAQNPDNNKSVWKEEQLERIKNNFDIRDKNVSNVINEDNSKINSSNNNLNNLGNKSDPFHDAENKLKVDNPKNAREQGYTSSHDPYPKQTGDRIGSIGYTRDHTDANVHFKDTKDMSAKGYPSSHDYYPKQTGDRIGSIGYTRDHNDASVHFENNIEKAESVELKSWDELKDSLKS